MKKLRVFIIFLLSLPVLSQNVQTDSQIYTPQQLVEDVLIHSDCVSNILVTNVVGGDFGGSDESYGYFDGSGTTFPFSSGIVLSTGRLQHVQGPNTSLSDDNAPGWAGDNDLETILNEPNTFNATILEFEFTTIADQINFNYLFASEEYQINNANTCQYSDLFGFLIRPASGTQYDNIALVPNTQTPVKVTTVHPEIPGGCPAENETYFGSWNGSSAPINFNGQTAVLTATANVTPNETYHVKLVIADEQNYRYDSAVFLEEGSFTAGKNLGPNRLLSTENPLCGSETLTLDATMPSATGYQWYQNSAPLPGETNPNYTVTQPGAYQVDIIFSGNCTATGNITVEYAPDPVVQNTTLTECDLDFDGLTTYNLWDAATTVTNHNQEFQVTSFHLDLLDAQQGSNAIANPASFSNTVPLQIVYAHVESRFGCSTVAEILLDISNESLTIPAYKACGPDTEDEQTLIDLTEVTTSFESQIPNNASVNYYENTTDAFSEVNAIASPYSIDAYTPKTLIVRVTNTDTSCFAMGTVLLDPVLNPILLPNTSTFYCLNSFPETLDLEAGITQGPASQYTYSWTLDGQPLAPTTETIAVSTVGTYVVTVTNQTGCFSTREITVLPSDLATIDTVTVTGTSMSVSVSGTGTYEFSVDHGPYQANNTFSQLPMGFHTVYVRDVNGCGITEAEFAVLGFPSFFTPNGDGYNDLWRPKGLEATIQLKIAIFDRYGKLLKEFNPHATGWDGTLNGAYLPNDDYWFLAAFEDGTEYRGHFALKR